MKNIVALTFLAFSTLTLANTSIEFDQGQEVSCYKEAKQLGCVKGEGEASKSCVEKNKKKLSKECQAMHKSKSLLK